MGDDLDDREVYEYVQEISIHVPRMGDDGGVHMKVLVACEISIHVPRMGDDK